MSIHGPYEIPKQDVTITIGQVSTLIVANDILEMTVEHSNHEAVPVADGQGRVWRTLIPTGESTIKIRYKIS